MNLLLLERSSELERIKTMDIDWAAHQADQVFLVSSLAEARAVLEEYPVHIAAAADTLDNGESGIAFLSELAAENAMAAAGPDIATPAMRRSLVLITAGTDFVVFQAAVRIGCADIVQAPAEKDALCAAVEQAAGKLRDVDTTLYMPEHYFVVEKFWLALLAGSLSGDPVFVENTAKKHDIPLYPDTRYVPVLLKISRIRGENDPVRIKRLELRLKSLCDEWIIKDRFRGCILEPRDGHFLLLLYLRGEQMFDREEYTRRCERVITEASENLGFDICFYIGVKTDLDGLQESINRINGMAFNNVSFHNRVFHAEGFVIPPESTIMPDTDRWSRLLLTMHPDVLKKEIDLYFQQVSFAGMMDRRLLGTFREDTLQMLYALLKDRGINAHEMTYDPILREQSSDAAETVENMRTFIWRAIDLTSEMLKEKKVSITDQVKAYTDLHYMEDISRETIAAQFFLHPDYLDRVFKKKEGLTVKNYITMKRIDNACRLLLETDLPVSLAASRSGYRNLAHFSMAFKKQKGMTPTAYRQQKGRPGTGPA